MPLTPEEVYAKVVELVGEDGRLPAPPVTDWDIFPWEVEDGAIVPKVLPAPLDAEVVRWGEGDKPCSCTTRDLPENAVWHNDRWVVTTPAKPGGMPLMMYLHPREHLDFGDMDDDLAAEFGKVTNWLHRIMANLPNIGRVHVNKWGDGGSHMHVFFVARYARMFPVIGSPAVDWDDMLPPPPEEVWRADVKHVADRLATHDGVALV